MKKRIAVDLGYSYTKVAYIKDDGTVNTIRFPSEVSETEENLNGSTYSFHGRKFVVGEKAYIVGNTIKSNDVPEFSLIYAPLLLVHAFRKTITPDILCASLSLAEMDKKVNFFNPYEGKIYKGKKIDLLKKTCSEFEINEQKYSTETKIFPQGAGIWLDIGKPENCIIVDIGFKTIDVMCFRDGIPLPSPYRKGFENVGLIFLVEKIQSVLEKETGIAFSINEVKKFLETGKAIVRGETIPLTKFDVEKEKNIYAGQIFTLVLRGKVKELYDRIGAVIIAGGGAYYMPSELKEVWNFNVPEKPEFSNVRGFLKMLGGDR